MRGPLPVYVDDPVARLQFIRRSMDGLKESKQAVGAATLAAVNNLAPPTILAQASRLNFSTRLFNLIVTNIPGPQMPLYVLGRELEDLFPVAFLPEDHALAIAIMSYNGGLDYGLLGDYDAMADIDVLADGIETTLAELLARPAAASGTAWPRRPTAGRPLDAERGPMVVRLRSCPCTGAPNGGRRPTCAPSASVAPAPPGDAPTNEGALAWPRTTG